ncbi:site-specific integrase [Peribacillus deserti]|uniref:Site-specific integrase n=1 Tax=Peribacillus deserti TaxID=673318 RepID=A0A2N5M828_9BACI|nr:site-specific integrase [Peribacillus deserti]PLT30509.1 site-specific integrase [Peribacillus deserti]
MAILQNDITIDIGEFSDESFDLETSIHESKEIINELVQENRWIKGEFEDDYWLVSKLLYSENNTGYDFSIFNTTSFNNSLPDNFKSIVKCWTVNLINEYKRLSITYLIQLKKCFEVTLGFRSEEKEALKKFLQYSDYSDKYKADMVCALLNFFDYADLEIADEYAPPLTEIKNKIKIKRNVRQLPPSKYVLSFSFYLDKYFNKVLDDTTQGTESIGKLLLIYPLVIWWRLTNVIPMRPSEFCSISRDCLLSKDDKRYIRLPRGKLKNTKRIQIPDKLLINEDMYRLIKNYIDLTKEYGKTDTLISYRSIMSVSPSTNRAVLTKNRNQFKPLNLESIIDGVYSTMIKEYDCHIPNQYRVKPGDTRHFTFISLMMQGYSPVEVARLGGHTTIKAQYHYNQHAEYWADCEVFRLMKKIKNASLNQSNNTTTQIPDEVSLKAFDSGDFRKKMKIGFCKDEQQRCESRRCYFCSKWGITPEEFLEKKEKIRSDIAEMKDNINELTGVVLNLNKQYLNHELNRRNPETLNKIKTKSNAIQSDLYKLALLCSKIGGGEVLDGEQVRW